MGRRRAWRIRSTSIEDDGIDFQWGDRYIRSGEVIDGVGGKYWKWNADGSITEYRPSQFRTRCAATCLGDYYRFETRDPIGYTELDFETPQLARQAASEINCSMFFSARSIEAIAEGSLLRLRCILGGVFESRYFPAHSPGKENQPSRCVSGSVVGS